MRKCSICRKTGHNIRRCAEYYNVVEGIPKEKFQLWLRGEWEPLPSNVIDIRPYLPKKRLILTPDDFEMTE